MQSEEKTNNPILKALQQSFNTRSLRSIEPCWCCRDDFPTSNVFSHLYIQNMTEAAAAAAEQIKHEN
jgi:hypothetical protein